MRTSYRRTYWALLLLTTAACAPGGEDDNTPTSEAETQSIAGKEAAPAPSDDATNESSEAVESDDPTNQARIFGFGTSCSPNPCQNGGTCVDLWNGYKCQCATGFTGTRCETPAVSCQTYTAASGGKCYGLYCGLTQSQLASKLSFFAACNQPSAFTCGGALPRAAGPCARNVKTANILDSNEQLRPKINACIAQNPAVAAARPSSTCTNCYTSYQLCITDRCLIECLAQDGPDCDACQRRSGCLPTLYSCTGLPNPL